MTDPSGVAVSGNPADEASGGHRTARFGVFELDLRSAELRRDGVKVKLQEQPFRMLAFLIQRAGDIVTRDELRERLWPAEFVDFDHGLNTAVRKLRTALDDVADNPRFIETVARRGYRFIAPVTWTAAPEATAVVAPRSRAPFIIAAAGVVLIVASALFLFQRRPSSAPSSAPANEVRAVAVLPFANSEKQNEHVSDGLTEILIDTLSRFPDLRVAGRTTVFKYKGAPADPRRVAEELNVDAIVTGVVRRDGDGYAIRVELIDARDGTQMWGDRYQASARDLPQVQSRISDDLSLRLREGATAPRRVYTANAEAYEIYLKGLYLWNSRVRSNVKQSADYFIQATELDPKFAAAYGSLANAYGVMVGNGTLTPEEGTLKVMAAASKALELDPSNAEAHTAIATTKFRNLWDFRGAERDYLRALASNPSYATAHQWYADYLLSMGRPSEALREKETAYRLEPFSAPVNRDMCFHLYYQRRYREALAWTERVGAIDPSFVALWCVDSAYREMNDYDSAVAARVRLAETPQWKAIFTQFEAVYRQSGRTELLMKEIEFMKAHQSSDTGIPVDIAAAYAALGDRDEAFAWLEKAYQRRLSRLTFFHVNPAFDNLRDDPRFDELRERIGLPKVAVP